MSILHEAASNVDAPRKQGLTWIKAPILVARQQERISVLGGDQVERAPDQEFPIAIATIPATTKQRRTAAGVISVLVLMAALVAPFAHKQLGRVDAFIPVLQTVLTVADLVTAVLLFAQYSIVPQRALLAVASAYLCSACFAFLQTLAFPGAYAPAGIIGDGFNSPAWFFVLWHVTFPLGILIYALLKDERKSATQLRGSAERSVGLTVFGVFIVPQSVSRGARFSRLHWVQTTRHSR